MKLAFTLLVLTALPVAGRAAPMEIKTGDWEVTTKTLMEGTMIPQEALAGMPPEQRAKLEAAMGANSGKTRTHTMHSCVTQKDLARGELTHSDKPNCKRTVITQNSRHLEIEETCAAPEASKSHFKFDAASAESYTGVMDMVAAEGAKVHMEMSGRFISATCKKGEED